MHLSASSKKGIRSYMNSSSYNVRHVGFVKVLSIVLIHEFPRVIRFRGIQEVLLHCAVQAQQLFRIMNREFPAMQTFSGGSQAVALM